MKNLISFTVIGLLVAIPAIAAPSAPERPIPPPIPNRPALNLPPSTQLVADDLFYLGAKFDENKNALVEGYAIVHRPKPDLLLSAAHRSGNLRGATACYGFFANGAKWKTIEPWLFNPNNLSGLTGLVNVFTSGIERWEDAAEGVVGNNSRKNILGDGSETTDVLSMDLTAPDNINEVYFADVDSPGAIAVTAVWGIFSGPIRYRELVEWDMVFDDQDYPWSMDGETSKMDFDNIAVHELGHAVGLIDLYNSLCSEETMYGYANYGETKKRDLATGDITGVRLLYR